MIAARAARHVRGKVSEFLNWLAEGNPGRIFNDWSLDVSIIKSK
jgi:hypothetical protein